MEPFRNLVPDPLIKLLRSAGDLIMEYYDQQNFNVETKSDNSPVTTADQASNNLILDGLKKLYPEIPVISEETTKLPFEVRKKWEYCWMVDPLDGTKEFLNRNGEFSINLALIHNHKPIAGFIHFPVQNWTYYAIKDSGAYKLDPKKSPKPQKLKNRKTCPQLDWGSKIEKPALSLTWGRKSKIDILISRSHSGPREYDFIEKLQTAGFHVETHPHGSAMKHCLIAEGVGDIYPKYGSCSEWDTAPGQIILEEAGGELTRTDNWQPLEYNKTNFENPEFIMWGPAISSEITKLKQIIKG